MNIADDEKMREVFQQVLKKIGQKILQGNVFDVMRISKPVLMSYPMTYLENVAK